MESTHSLHPIVEAGGLVDYSPNGIVITFPPRPGRDDAPEPAVFADGADTEVIAAALRHLDIPIHAGAGPLTGQFVVETDYGKDFAGRLAMASTRDWEAGPELRARPRETREGIQWTTHPPTGLHHAWCVVGGWVGDGQIDPWPPVPGAPRFATRRNRAGDLWHTRCGCHIGSARRDGRYWVPSLPDGTLLPVTRSRREAVGKVLHTHLPSCPDA